MGARMSNMDDLVLPREMVPVVKALIDKERERLEEEIYLVKQKSNLDWTNEERYYLELWEAKLETLGRLQAMLAPEQDLDIVRD